MKGREIEPLVRTSIRVDDEVGEGFVEGPNRTVDVLLEDEQGLS